MPARLFEPRATPVLKDVPQASSDIVPVAAAPVDLTTFPKLLAAGTSDEFHGHHSHQVLAALAQNAAHNSALEAELAALGANGASFRGHASGDIASALAEYAQSHPGQTVGAAMLAAGVSAPSSSSSSTGTSLAATAGVTELTLTSAFSWAAQLQGLQWARIIYGITWIVGGLTLLFFGYSSLFWFAKTGERKASGGGGGGASLLSAASTALPGLRGASKTNNGARKAPLGGGLGGILIGFFSFSYLAAVIHASVAAASPARAVSSGAFFAVWLVPGLVGAALCGHFKLAAKTMSGVMGGFCLTLILTAIFGIHTILIRSILLAIFGTLHTAPLLLPRSVLLQRLILSANTSLLGVVAFLDGVALFAPPKASSAAWIDLWVLLFAKDDSAAATQAVQAWGTSAFKGYIAGAVLGAAIGFAFEVFLHRHAGEDAEASWNEYLGAYADRYEKSGMLPGQFEGSLARQGLFEPAPSAWQKLANLFDSGSSTRPASYGNVPGGQRAQRRDVSEGASTLTELPRLGLKAKRARSSRSKSSRGPARFEALGRNDVEAAEDSDDTEVNSDDEDKAKARLLTSGGAYKGVELHDADVLSPLARSTYALPGQLPRPPLQGAEAQSTSSSYTSEVMQTTSNLSGSTKVSSTHSAIDGEAHKPYTSYRDSAPTSPSAPAHTTAAAGAGGVPVPATPSLIRAISRIESAQAQARAWQAQQAATGGPAAPYGATPVSPPPNAPAGTAVGGAKFDEWWKNEVKGAK